MRGGTGILPPRTQAPGVGVDMPCTADAGRSSGQTRAASRSALAHAAQPIPRHRLGILLHKKQQSWTKTGHRRYGSQSIPAARRVWICRTTPQHDGGVSCLGGVRQSNKGRDARPCGDHMGRAASRALYIVAQLGHMAADQQTSAAGPQRTHRRRNHNTGNGDLHMAPKLASELGIA